MSTKPRSLDEDDVEAAGDLMARAFQHTPGFTWVFDDPDERLRWFGSIFRLAAQGGRRFGEATGIASPLEGVMIVYPLDAAVDEQEKAQFDESAERAIAREVGDVVYRRLTEEFNGRIFAAADRALRRHLNPDALYLDLLAVEPTRQGCGVGSSLVESLHVRADQEGKQCGLLTFEPRAVPFYRRHGYSVVAQDIDAPSGVRWWSLVRQPTAS